MQIPQNAKCVFKGIIFDIYQWQQKLFDGTYTTYELAKRKSTSDVIATINDKIVILMQQQPTRPLYPSLVAGKIEPNENPLDCAKRELLEETGLQSDNWTLHSQHFGESKLHFHESLYIARDCKKIQNQNLDPGEKIQLKLVTFDEFLQYARDPKFSVIRELKFLMYEALLDNNKKQQFKKQIFG